MPRVLDQVASAIERNRERLIDILSLENGKRLGARRRWRLDGSPEQAALLGGDGANRRRGARHCNRRPGSLSDRSCASRWAWRGLSFPGTLLIILAVRSFAPSTRRRLRGRRQDARPGRPDRQRPGRDPRGTHGPAGRRHRTCSSRADRMGAALLVESARRADDQLHGKHARPAVAIGAVGAQPDEALRAGIRWTRRPMIVFDDADIERHAARAGKGPDRLRRPVLHDGLAAARTGSSVYDTGPPSASPGGCVTVRSRARLRSRQATWGH